MRPLATATSILILLTLVPPVVPAYHDPTPPPQNRCPEYVLVLGDEMNGLQMNAAGQFLIAFSPGTGLVFSTEYFVSDAPSLDPRFGDALFSWWWYFEANGHPGLQRADEVCTNPLPEGVHDSDFIHF